MKTKNPTANFLLLILAVILGFHAQAGGALATPMDRAILSTEADSLIMVTGTVFDEDGEALIGVNVQVKGMNKGTSTDFDGHFELSDVEENTVLVFSYIGYVTREVHAQPSHMTIEMTSDAELLDEVVVVGYGIQKKVNLTGAVDVITQDDIQNRSVTNVTEALQGVSPNLNITQTGTSGEPGGALNINIRGIGSLTGDASPYILVDGVPMDLNEVNPSDIESISVLKDAAASAIYGSRAPYGVILITTKTGQSGDEKPQIQYSNNFSFSSPIGLPHMTNSLNFVTAYDQASVNAGLSPNFTEANIERIRQYMAGDLTEETWKLPDENDWAGNGIWNIAGNGNNDWLHIFYDDNVLRQKHDMSIRGGGEHNTYYFSAGLWDQPGELRFGDQFYKRYNLTTNLSSNVTDWLTFNLSSKFINEKFQYFNTTQGWNRTTQYHNFLRTNPFRPLYLPNGEYSQISNISMMEDGGKEVHNGTTLTTRLSAVLEPVKNWQTTISYSFRGEFLDINNNRASVFGSLPDESLTIVAYPLSSYINSKYVDKYQLFNLVSNYQLDLGSHHFSVLGGIEQELNQHSGVWGQKDNIITSSVPSISTSTGQIYLNDELSHWATQGVFGRIQYRFADKYLTEFNARYDGSSRFAEGNRWGFFPSVSVGYIVSEENFWKPLKDDVNEFKIRASWGRLGNQNVANYLYIERLGISTDLGWVMGSERPNYATSPGIISPDLTWETSETRNIGFNASLLDYRLDFSLDVFERVTRDMFGPSEALPILLGTTPPQRNNASLKTNGFEFSVGWRDDITDVLSYNVRFNLADNRSVVTEYNNPTKTLSTWYEGQEIGEIWGLQTEGIYQSDSEAEAGPDQSLFYPTWGAGDMHYHDLDGDNKINRGSWTAGNSGDYSVIGNQSPRYLIGLNGGIQWKDFSLSVFIQGVGKRDFAFNGTANDIVFFGFNGQRWWNMTVMEQHLDYWRPQGESNLLGPNPNSYYPKPYLSQEDFKNRQVQTRYTQNAAFLRLKNVNLSYKINQNVIERIGFLQGASIVLSGENLATLTSLTKLVDPEALSSIGWGVGKIHPLRRTFSVGINLNF